MSVAFQEACANQYTTRTVPGAVDVIGSATNAATVTVNNLPTYRNGAYYRAQLPLTNTSNPVWQSVTNLAVLNQGTTDVMQTNITGNLYLPKTPENFSYDADGNLTNDGRWQYTWDAENRLISLTNNASVPAGAQMRLTFGYDAKGRRISKAVNVGGTVTTQSFLYDGWNLIATLYRDATFAAPGFGLTNNANNSFTAVAADSLGRSSTNNVTAFYIRNPQYAYDLNGNLLSDSKHAFAYDDENQLTNVLVTNTWMTQFAYDGKLRMRIRKEFTWAGSAWAETNEVHYVYDGNLVIQERNSNNIPQVTYTRGRDLSGSLQGAGGIGGLLARSDNTRLNLLPSAPAHAYYHADGNGNVTALINLSQALVAKYLYDPYGNLLSLSGPLAAANSYRFSSKEYHQNSGLYYYLYRFYDPNLQRWVNRDPISENGGLNLYGFILNNPICFIDLYGHSDYWPWTKWDYNPIQAYVHGCFDVGAGISEGAAALVHAADTAFSAGNANRNSDPENNLDSSTTADGNDVNTALPSVEQDFTSAITGIPGTFPGGDVPTVTGPADAIATGVSGALSGPAYQSVGTKN